MPAERGGNLRPESVGGRRSGIKRHNVTNPYFIRAGGDLRTSRRDDVEAHGNMVCPVGTNRQHQPNDMKPVWCFVLGWPPEKAGAVAKSGW